MFTMNTIGHLERCAIVRCMAARLIDARLEGVKAEEAYMALGREAAEDFSQRRQLLVPGSKLIH